MSYRPLMRPLIAALAIGTIATAAAFTFDRSAEATTTQLNFGGRKIEKLTLDPGGRFPDRDASDNQCPRATPVVP